MKKLPPICVALGCADATRLRQLALEQCALGETFLEFRLDQLRRPANGVAVIREVLELYPDTRILATCRRREASGEFKGTVEQELAHLDAAVDAGACAVDLAIETVDDDPAVVERFAGRAARVVSYHNFERTPALARVAAKLRRTGADVVKLATMGAKPSDSLRALALLAEAQVPTVPLVMGEPGWTSRLLSVSRGAAFTFAAPNPSGAAAEGTAPGQMTADVLRSQFRVNKISTATKVYGVIADPVVHSMSPALHNRAFRARRIDAVYLPFRVEREYLRDFFKMLRELPVQGVSVTIPHKQRVGKHLDQVDGLAKRIGAINTVYRDKRGKLRGTNTDALGVTRPLEKRGPLRGRRVLVAGNGGAARGAVFALRDKGARVAVTGRSPDKVRQFARSCQVDAVARAEASSYACDILVHASAAGMHPQEQETFFPDGIPGDVVFDMVYNPLETRLLRDAKAAGKQTISGLEMFVEQAVAQFEIWTEDSAPRTAMRNAVLAALGSR